MATYLVIFLLFFLHLIVIPIGVSPFEAPKVVLAEIIIEILLILKLLKFRKHHLQYLNTQNILIFILFALSVFDLLLFKGEGSFFGNPFRLQGVFLFWHLLIFSLISKDIKIDHKKLLITLSFSFLLAGTLVLGVDENRRAFGTLGEPNSLAATAIFLFPFIFFQYQKFQKIAIVFTTLAIILFSGSRAGLVALIIQLIFISLNHKLSMSKSVLVSLFLIILSLSLPFAQDYSWFENRTLIWQTAIEAGKNSPLIGVGIGNIQNPLHQTAQKLGNLVSYQAVDSSHNFILDFWIQGGLVGTISIIVLIFLTLQSFARKKKILETTAFLGIITTMLFNPLSVVILTAFWWFIGQGANNSYNSANASD